MTLYEYIGWIGSILFAICAIPQVIQCYKQGHGKGLSWAFLTCWLLGEILTMAYIIPKKDYPLIFNYTVNLVCLVIIISYKLFPQERYTNHE